MRSLVWFCLLVAAAATAVLGLLVLRRPLKSPPLEPPPAAVAEPSPEPPEPEKALRPYETVETLAEDLRDALAGPAADLARELDRVTKRLRSDARRVLLETAPAEASPKLRALLVYAAGSHVPDEETLLAFLDDPAPEVRGAAALAAAHKGGSSARRELLPGIAVPVGRALPEGTRRALEARLTKEKDEGVRGTIAAALAAR